MPTGNLAFDEGFKSFPVSLPFPPLGSMTAHQRGFYAGWLEAAVADLARPDRQRPTEPTGKHE